MKLRSFLTFSGIVIAIAAFVAMLSFGAGMQQNINEQFDKLGLLSIIQVYPEEANDSDSTTIIPLDNAAIERIEKIPGVELVYPYESIELTVSFADSVKTIAAQALSQRAVRTKLFSNLTAGSLFDSDSSKEILVTEDFSKSFGVGSADSIIGESLSVSIKVSQIDSGIVAVLQPLAEIYRQRRNEFHLDSLQNREYIRRIAREELSGGLKRFVDGFMNDRETVSDTLIVRGVLEPQQAGHLRLKDMIIPVNTARKFISSGFTGNITDIFATIQSGNLFDIQSDSFPGDYSQVTVVMGDDALYAPIRDSLETAGFRTFSFAEQFDEIRRFFRYFNLALGLVGLIALMTASLGIINTMIMSITERRREIGVWMSLGARKWDIRRLFLVESGLIGLIGAAGGIIFGWVISRIGSFIVKTLMENEGVPPVELFYIPAWLVISALTFGVLVSLLAGYYPANRAAKIDPVASLRNE
jgi:putative ABC transport system permease protein